MTRDDYPMYHRDWALGDRPVLAAAPQARRGHRLRVLAAAAVHRSRAVVRAVLRAVVVLALVAVGTAFAAVTSADAHQLDGGPEPTVAVPVVSEEEPCSTEPEPSEPAEPAPSPSSPPSGTPATPSVPAPTPTAPAMPPPSPAPSIGPSTPASTPVAPGPSTSSPSPTTAPSPAPSDAPAPEVIDRTHDSGEPDEGDDFNDSAEYQQWVLDQEQLTHPVQPAPTPAPTTTDTDPVLAQTGLDPAGARWAAVLVFSGVALLAASRRGRRAVR